MSLKSINKNNTPLLSLSLRIKKLRAERGLTQLQCFQDTNIHVGRIEQGKRDASFTTIYKLCKYFDITLEEFFNEGFD